MKKEVRKKKKKTIPLPAALPFLAFFFFLGFSASSPSALTVGPVLRAISTDNSRSSTVVPLMAFWALAAPATTRKWGKKSVVWTMRQSFGTQRRMHVILLTLVNESHEGVSSGASSAGITNDARFLDLMFVEDTKKVVRESSRMEGSRQRYTYLAMLGEELQKGFVGDFPVQVGHIQAVFSVFFL